MIDNNKTVNLKIKLIDIKTKTLHGVEFGTCDMCFHVGDLDVTHIVFHLEKIGRVFVEMGYWDYGSYMDYLNIDVNIIDLADYVNRIGVIQIPEKYLDEIENLDWLNDRLSDIIMKEILYKYQHEQLENGKGNEYE